MTEYEAQAKQFLADCNATMEIRFIGKDIPPHWLSETKPHNKYQFTITIPKGKYTSYFWDSLRNTEIGEMTADDLACKKYKAHYDVLRMHERTNVLRELKRLKANAIPTEYDILSCVEKYSYDSSKAEQCLIDNGIAPDDAPIVLQALGYILFDEELYPEE
jgi:hypothetical protein